MRIFALAAAVTLAAVAPALAQVHVGGYTRRDGTYVEPHYRSAPNSSTFDNYSTKGNVNPYTGQAGRTDPYGSYNSYGTSRRRSGY